MAVVKLLIFSGILCVDRYDTVLVCSLCAESSTSDRNEPINEVLNDHVIRNRYRDKKKLYFESNEIFDETNVIHTTDLPLTTDSVNNNAFYMYLLDFTLPEVLVLRS
jgi:hypothetical protein